MTKYIIIIASILAITFSSCKEFEDIKVIDVDSFHINKLTVEGIEAEINLKIKNPNTYGFSIYPSDFDISLSGMRLGKAKLHKRVHIGANCERVYSFKLKSKLSDLNPFDMMRLLNNDNLGKIEVKGDLKAGKFYLKRKFNINYVDNVKILQ